MSNKKQVIRVEPYSTILERLCPVSVACRYGDTVYLAGLPPFDKEKGKIFEGSIEEQTKIVLDQMKEILEASGTSMDNVIKATVYATSVDDFTAINEVYKTYFTGNPPARIFVNLPKWPGPHDIEIDCVAGID